MGPTAGHPRRTRLLLIAAVVVLLAVAAAALAIGWPRDDEAGAARGPVVPITTCPTTWGAEPTATDPWVPVPPSVPGARSRLVPETPPTAALVCGYTGPTTALTAHATLAGDLTPVTAALTGLPRQVAAPMCSFVLLTTDDDDYLVGLTYPDGTLWVGAPHNHCTGASNGAFTTTTNVGGDAAAWLAAGRYAAPADDASTPTPDSPCTTATGRLGQDAALVPDTPTSLTICVDDGGSADRAVVVPVGRIAAVVMDLAALPTVASTSICQGSPEGTSYTLTFGYADGPGVQIFVTPGCDPPVDNGSLQSSGTGDLLPLLAALTR